MNPTKTRIKDILWHGCKALLCAAQLWVFHLVTMKSVGNLMSFLYTELVVREGDLAEPFLALIHPVTLILLFFFLWRYYDNVDDRSFNQFCETYKDKSEAPFLLKEIPYAVGFAVTILGATPVISASLIPALKFTGMRHGECTAVATAAALVLVVGLSVLRLHRRSAVWIVQKDLRTGNEKTRWGRRIFYAVIFFVSIYALIFLGFSTLVPTLGSLILGILRLLWKPILIIGGILFLWLFVIRSVRRMIDRRKFMKKLDKMRERGELSYEIHGSPTSRCSPSASSSASPSRICPTPTAAGAAASGRK